MRPQAPPFALDAPTLEEVDRLFGLMAKHGVTQCVYRGVTIVRPLADPPSVSATRENELDALNRMTSDKVDRELMLRRTGGLG